jgi:pimeloyl-ACP methyl ester carboxylesterase
MEIKHSDYDFGGVTLHVAEAGNPNGKVIIFLHGFPEFWYGWHKQLDYFTDKGYRVMAPDQRGYNGSSKPKGVKAYTIEKLTGDIIGLIQQATAEKVYLVGHDWGGAVAWALAQHHSHLLEKLIVLNMPHPEVMEENLKKNPKQMLRSWYAGFFQLPVLPEITSSASHYSVLKRSMKASAKEGTFSEEDMRHYKTAWQQKGALTAMINWYRAYKYSARDITREVTIPTLLLWGKQDTFLTYTMAEPSIDKCTNGKLIYLEDATHWLHHEKPDEVDSYIYNFIR